MKWVTYSCVKEIQKNPVFHRTYMTSASALYIALLIQVMLLYRTFKIPEFKYMAISYLYIHHYSEKNLFCVMVVEMVE